MQMNEPSWTSSSYRAIVIQNEQSGCLVNISEGRLWMRQLPVMDYSLMKDSRLTNLHTKRIFEHLYVLG